jgi:hypothetical protein
MFTFGNIDPSSQTYYIIQCSWHHPSTWQNMKTGKQFILAPLTIVSQVLQRTTTLLHMIHPITQWTVVVLWNSQKFGYSLMKCKPTTPTHKSTQNTYFEKDLWPLLKPLNFSLSPLINHQNQSSDWISTSLCTLRNGFFVLQLEIEI